MIQFNFCRTEKYPQIKKLFGYDPNFKWIVTGMITIQMVMLFFIPKLPWYLVLGLAYGFGGTINHSLMLGKYTLAMTNFNSIEGER